MDIDTQRKIPIFYQGDKVIFFGVCAKNATEKEAENTKEKEDEYYW